MEWLSAIRMAIAYIEKHLDEKINLQDISQQVHISPYILTKGFTVMTGYSVSEYIRGRRLYLAALSLRDTHLSILDIALNAQYDTPESFAKAFSRFHGHTPSAVRNGAPFQAFLPLSIHITIQGGNQMDCKITKMSGFKLIGFQKEFMAENSFTEIPKYWDEIWEKYAVNPPTTPCEKAMLQNRIGEYAVCIDDMGCDKFRYLIAGKYTGGEVPDGMVLYQFPAGEWAVFDCIGPMPDALQELTTQIFKQWLPANPEFELSGEATIEWYDDTGDTNAADYRSAIWLPVKRK